MVTGNIEKWGKNSYRLVVFKSYALQSDIKKL